MNQFDAKFFCKRVAEFAECEAFFGLHDAGILASALPPYWVAKFKKTLHKSIVALGNASMDDGKLELERIQKLVLSYDLNSAELSTHAQTARNAVVQECGKRKFLRVGQGLGDYVDNESIFGQLVHDSFPSARPDLRDAGNC
jgi:hypothetical protein